MNPFAQTKKRLTEWWRKREVRQQANPATRKLDENDPKFPEKDFQRLGEIFFKSGEVIKTLQTAGWIEIEQILLDLEKGYIDQLVSQEDERVRGKIELIQEFFTRLEQSKAHEQNAFDEVKAKGYDVMFSQTKKEEEVI